MSYYDIDSILTDSQVSQFIVTNSNTDICQKLPCTFDLEVPGLGILEGNAGEDVRLWRYFCSTIH